MTVSSKRIEDSEYVRRFNLDMAFRLLTSARAELIAQALPLLPASTKLNTVNDHGFTALMMACISGDEKAVLALIDAGSNVNTETPAQCTTTTSSSQVSSPQARSPASVSQSNSRNFLCQSPIKNVNQLGLNGSSNSLISSPNQNNNNQPHNGHSVIASFITIIDFRTYKGRLPDSVHQFG